MIAIVDETTEIDVVSNSAINDGDAHIAVILGDRSGNLTMYIDGILQTDTAAMAGTTCSNSESLYFGADAGASEFYQGGLYLVRLFNRLLPASEAKTFSSNPGALITYDNESASNTDLTSGTLTIGKRYRINTFVAGDDFTNVGAASNATGIEFVATGTTPTTWTNSSVLNAIGCIAEWKGLNATSGFWYDQQNYNSALISGASLVNSNYIIDTLSTGIQGVDWEAKDLLINKSSNTQATMKASRIRFLNQSYIVAHTNSFDETFDITTDLQSGTSEKNSHWYQLWIDSNKNRLMVPDLEGTADSDVANSLSVSGATFQTDNVAAGDPVYNMDAFTSGFIGAVSSETLLTCVDADGNDLDLFPNGNENFKIHCLSPVGLGDYKANVGTVYNNSSGHLDDSGYTKPELQNKIAYGLGDFTLTETSYTGVSGSFIEVSQDFEFGNTPVWVANGQIAGQYSSYTTTSQTIDISGIVFKNTTGLYGIVNTSCAKFGGNVLDTIVNQYIAPNTGTITLINNSVNYSGYWSYEIYGRLDKKPTFATRS